MKLSRTRRKYPHRCMRYRDGWYVRRNGKRERRRCLARMTFDHYARHPKCPCCGSRLHWAIEMHRAEKLDRDDVCRDSRCPYHYPHSHHSEHCVNRPSRDLLGVSKRRAFATEEPPF